MAFTNEERFDILMAGMDYLKVRYGTEGPWQTPEPTDDAKRISRLFEVIELQQRWLSAMNEDQP
jgi:hypothetical protein